MSGQMIKLQSSDGVEIPVGESLLIAYEARKLDAAAFTD